MSLNIFFWNIMGFTKKNSKTNVDNTLAIETIIELTSIHHFDVIILAECPEPADRNLIETQLKKINANYKDVSQFGTRIVIFHKLRKANDPVHIDLLGYITIPLKKVIIVGLHLHGRNQGTNEQDLYTDAGDYKDAIIKLSEKEKAEHIIVVGDFNMDPFEPGLVYKKYFNATFSKYAATGKIPQEKTIMDEIDQLDLSRFPYLYNPSWHLHGNYSTDIPGTFYARGSTNRVIFHMLDQVLLSPNLIEQFDYNNFEILAKYEYQGQERTLVSKNGIPIEKISDHLPIRFKINI